MFEKLLSSECSDFQVKAPSLISHACAPVLSSVDGPSVPPPKKLNFLHMHCPCRCEADVYFVPHGRTRKIATLTIHTPDLRDPCRSSDELLELFKWLPVSEEGIRFMRGGGGGLGGGCASEVEASKTTLPPLHGQLHFTPEVRNVANTTESQLKLEFFQMFGDGTGTAPPYMRLPMQSCALLSDSCSAIRRRFKRHVRRGQTAREFPFTQSHYVHQGGTIQLSRR